MIIQLFEKKLFRFVRVRVVPESINKKERIK